LGDARAAMGQIPRARRRVAGSTNAPQGRPHGDFAAPLHQGETRRPKPGGAPKDRHRPSTRTRDIGFKAVVVVGALAMGAAADFAVRSFGVTLPPLFTLFWGSGSVIFILFASAQRNRSRDEEIGTSLSDVCVILDESNIVTETETSDDQRFERDA
jgi:hypothetical protein